MRPTQTGVDGDVLNSTLGPRGGSSALADVSNAAGNTTLLIVYVLLGVGAVTPVVLLLVVAAVLRSRRAGRRAARRRVTYNSAPTVDAVVDAWNKPATAATAAAVAPADRSSPSSGRQESAGGLSELAVRQFFDVPDRRQCAQLYVSVEPRGGPAYGGAASTSPPESSTPGSSEWPSAGSDSSAGDMERRARDFVALIGPATTTNVHPQTAEQHQTTSDDVATVPCDPSPALTASTVVESAPDSCLQNGQNGPRPADSGCRSAVQTVVVDVEPQAVNDGHDDEQQRGAPLSKMRRSEACYDIAVLSTSNVPDDDSSSKSSPVGRPSTDGVRADTAAQCTEDLSGEEEQALKCLDAIAYDYADDNELREPTEKVRSKL